MVFAPKLEGGVAYNQPVQQPNAMEAIAGLFNFGLDVASKQASDQPKLTEDEKFAIAVKEFEDSKGATFQWDRKGMREFIFNYPQFNSQAKSYAENLGVMVQAPEEVARDSALEWFKTPEGMLAVAQAQTLPEDEREAFLAEQVTKVKTQEAEIAKITRNATQLQAEGTLATAQWDVLKPTSKDTVDHVVSTVLNPLLTEVLNGVTVEIDPQLQAQLGVRYTKVDGSNINALLADAKIYLTNQMRGKYYDQFGEDALPPETWNKEVFAGLDGLIELGQAVKDPVARAATLKAVIDSEFYKTMDENGLALTLKLVEAMPPDVANIMIGKIAGLEDQFIDALTDSGSVLTTKGIVQKVADGSKSDAEKLATDVIQFFDKGFVPEFFTLFKAAAEKSGFNVVDGASFKEIIGNNVEEIKRLSATNPDTKIEIQDFLTKDILQTITTVNNNLVAGVTIQFDGKKFIMVPEPGSLADQKWNDSYRPYSQFALDQLPEGMNLDVLNEKIATLGLLGDVGVEVQGAIGILNQPEKTSTETNTRGRGRGRGTSSSSSSEGDIGNKLGIDFAKYESEAGLPAGYLNKIAMIESGGNPNANNPNSSAGGLFQQIDSNAAAYGVVNRFDPVQSTEGAVRFAVDNKNYLMGILGREPTGGELYLAHQQGPAGAARLLANPDAKAVDIVGMDAIKLNGGNANMTAGEFANIWISKYNGSRGQTTGSYSAPQSAPTVSIDSSAGEIPERVQGSSTASTESLQTNLISYDSPELQQIVEMAQSQPEEAIRVAKEVLAGKPIDPSIKALIEALVRIGEKK